MNSRKRHILRVLASILVGIMAFFIALVLIFCAEFLILSKLQLDFMFPSQLVILFVIACVLGLIIAILAGKKYYREWDKLQ